MLHDSGILMNEANANEGPIQPVSKELVNHLESSFAIISQ